MRKCICIIKKSEGEDALSCTRRGRSICEHVWRSHADTSVVRNVSANMSGSLMQIHKWSEMYLQTCLEASCRYISDQKCICKHAWKSHVDTSVVRNVSANASGSFVQIHRR